MREHKFVPMLFSFYDRTGIEKDLEKRARKGWMLEKITALGWKFRREEPREVNYTVCYFPGASPYDPEPSEAELIFLDFCRHTGWEMTVSNGQMKVFHNENPDPVPIETDPLLELENIHASVKKTFLPIYIMDLILAIMQIGLFVGRVHTSFIGTFSMDWQFFGVLWWPFLLILCVVELLRYYLWRRRAIRVAYEDGRFLDTPNTAGFQCAVVVTSIGALILMILSVGDSLVALMMLGVIGGIFAITALVVFLTNVMKRRKVSAAANHWISVAIGVVLSLVLTFGLIFGILSRITAINYDDSAVGTYQYKGDSYNIYRDEIPLKIEDLMETDYEEYNYYLQWDEESIFLSKVEAMQRPRYDALEEPRMSYTIVDVKWKIFYNACLNDMLDDYEGWSSEDIYGNVFHDSFILADAAPWGAEKVYQLKQGGADEMSQSYILCYPGKLVKIQFDWEVTPEQMGKIGTMLGK